jgi:hypothetical protein
VQELGLQNAWISETIFWSLFIPFILWSFSPFVTVRKRFYTAVIYARILVVLSLCQFLRILSFTVTQLPAPNYHCRAGEDTAILPMPESWWGHIVINLGRQATHGCGDLIFSSHTTFVLVGCLTFTEYGETLLIKIISWIGVAMMSLCIVASRKHYSVDVVVAWYTVPLVFYAMMRRWTTVRPPRDYWPHRPLVVEDLGVPTREDDGDLSPDSKPLLPVVNVPSYHHVRQGSKGGEVRPPPGKHSREDSVSKAIGSNGRNGSFANGVMSHSRRPSTLANGSSSSLRELEMQEMENGVHLGKKAEDKDGPSSNNDTCRIS